MIDQTNPTILPPEMTGVMHVTGYQGLGKSWLLSQADLPENIAFFDFEDKGKGIDTQLKFGYYTTPMQKAEGDPQQTYNITMKELAALQDNKYTVVIFDNISHLELAMNTEARRQAEYYAKRFGLVLKNVRSGAMGGTKAIVNFMISEMCAKLHGKGIKLIGLTSHVKPPWTPGGPITNKQRVLGAARWGELSILTLILIGSDNPPVPSALVKKEQLGKISIDGKLSPEQLDAMRRGEAGHTMSRRLPYRIRDCTFQQIRYYLHNPADFGSLKDYEIPAPSESDPFNASLTNTQLSIIEMQLAKDARDAAEKEELIRTLDKADKLAAVGVLVGKVQKIIAEQGDKSPLELKGILGDGYAIPQIAQAVQQIKKEK